MKKLAILLLSVVSLNCFGQLIPKEPQKVLLFLHDQVEILDFAGPMEVFIQAGFEVYTVSMTKDPITAMGTLKIIPDYSVDDFPKADIATFYGGGWAQRKAALPAYKKHVLEMTKDAAIQFSVCTGAFFLAETGYLENKQATTFHTLTGRLQERFQTIEVLEGVRFVDNGEVITTAGISAGIDGALHIVAKVYGIESARRVATNMEYDKWVPGEGRIHERSFISLAKKTSFKEAASKAKPTKVFKGELLTLSDYYVDQLDLDQAIDVLEYIQINYTADFRVDSRLSRLYRATKRKGPLDHEEFMAIARKDFNKAKKIYDQTLKDFPGWTLFSQGSMNALGYSVLEEDVAKAVDIFKFNAEVNPDHWNMWDSLGEGYLLSGDKKNALKYYEKSVAMNPNNTNGVEMIEQIKSSKKADTN